ncbi:MAG: hypothetical protein LBS20_15555 [Prevotella sp.]|jgi:hypothetical protein|nr:hypothetical protein [Prevotella sp.]
MTTILDGCRQLESCPVEDLEDAIIELYHKYDKTGFDSKRSGNKLNMMLGERQRRLVLPSMVSRIHTTNPRNK